MTKKDYIAIADAINRTAKDNDLLISAMCSVFTADNQRFDRKRFIEAATR